MSAIVFVAKSFFCFLYLNVHIIHVCSHGMCPCMSYYSNPDYGCLGKYLDSNKTLPPTCVSLLQRLDPFHKFTIKEGHEFHCADYDEIFVLNAGDRDPRLIQNHFCMSTFENGMSLDIVSSRGQFYEVVSKNAASLQLQSIQCELNLFLKPLQDLDSRCAPDQNIKSLFSTLFSTQSQSTLFSIIYAYNNGSLLPTNFTLYDDKLTVGFVHPNWDRHNFNAGKILINHSHKEPGPPTRLIFSCSWAEGSDQFGGTKSCLDLADLDITSERNRKLQLHLSNQRIFKNSSIEFGLVWDKHRDKDIKNWNVVCKFFVATDHLYQPESCIACWTTGRNCSECWNSASLNGLSISPFFCIILPGGRTFYNTNVVLLTNFHHMEAEDGTSVKFEGNNKGFYHFDIFQYDYFFGDKSRYIENADNPFCFEFPKWTFIDSVALPGRQKDPTALSLDQLNSLSAMCRVRATYADDNAGEWSNTVVTSFNRTAFHASYIAVLYGSGQLIFYDFLLVARWRRTILPIHTYKQADFSVLQAFDICQSPQQSYVAYSLFFARSTPHDDYYTLSLYYKVSKNEENHENLISTSVHAKSKPLVVKCAMLHPFILWTEQVEEESDKLTVFQAILDSLTGQPVPNGVTELNSTMLCGCSNQKSVTAPSFNILYTNLSNPEHFEIAVGCGKTICLTDLAPQSSRRVHFPWKNDYGNIVTFAMDRTAIAFVTSDDRTQLKINVLGQTTVSVHSTHGLRITELFTMGEIDVMHFPVPYRHCMNPYVNENNTEVMVSENGTIEITITELWNNTPQCAQFTRPAARLEIAFALVPESFNYTEDKMQDLQCKSFLIHCTYIHHKGVWGLSFTKSTPQTVPNRFYYIEITVKAFHDYYLIWYRGQQADLSQTYKKVIFTKSQSQSPLAWIIPASTIGSLIFVTLVFGIIYWRYTQKMYMYKHLNRLSVKDIQKLGKLGEGNFGEIWKARLGKDTIVVKMLKESATDREEKEFREEALFVSKFNSEHIVHTVGICLQTRPIMLGLEYVNGGSLRSYLKRDDVRLQLVSTDLLHIAADALKGCTYLEQEGYIHRDIAARNCLVETESDFNVKPKCVKLSDFGLAKDIGSESAYRSRDPDAEILPIAWTAPEGFGGKFSPKSDVWAFGVLLWEIFTWAATPYGQCSDTSDKHRCPNNQYTHDEIEFHVCVKKETLLDLPDPCTGTLCTELKHVLLLCWEFVPEERPSFYQLQKYLNGAKKEISKTNVHMGLEQLSQPTDAAIRASSSDDHLAEAYDSGTKKVKLLKQAYGTVQNEQNLLHADNNLHVGETCV